MANDDLKIAYIAWCLFNDWDWILLRPIGRHWWIKLINLLDQWLSSMPGNCSLEFLMFFFMAKSPVLEAMTNVPTSSDVFHMTERWSYWSLLGWLFFAFENQYLFVFWTQKWIFIGERKFFHFQNVFFFWGLMSSNEWPMMSKLPTLSYCFIYDW